MYTKKLKIIGKTTLRISCVILLIWIFIKGSICILKEDPRLGILFVAILSFIIVIIRIMETFKIKKVTGEFAKTDQGTIFLLKACIVYTGYTFAHITDIKVQINEQNKMFCFLEGNITTEKENNAKIVTTSTINYSNKDIDYLDFRIPLTSNINYLRIRNTYLSTPNIFVGDTIAATLTIETNPQLLIKILNYLLFLDLQRTKEFRFKKVDKIEKKHGELEIPLINEQQ